MLFSTTILPFFALVSLSFCQTAPPEPILLGNCTTQSKYYDQLIDHANTSSKATFKQQYQIIDDYFKPGGPILFYQGAETATIFCLEQLIISSWAKELGGLAVTLEHRFFGASLPSNVENLVERYKTLTLDNVMLDSVTFLEYVKDTVPGANNSKIIVTGASYSGYLSTLERINHPETFYGAISWGAPVRGLGYANPVRAGWFEWTSNAYYDASYEAATKIKNAMYGFQANVKNATDFSTLTTTYNTCTPIKNSTDLSALYTVLLTAVNDNAQLSYAAGSPILPPGKKGNSFDRAIQAVLAAQSDTEVLSAHLDLYFEGNPCVDLTLATGGYVASSPVPYGRLTCSFVPLSINIIPNGTIFPPMNEPAGTEEAICNASYGVVPDTIASLLEKYKFTVPNLAKTKRLFLTSSGLDGTSPLTALELFDVATTDRQASRMKTMNSAAHVEDCVAPFPGAKPEVTAMQNVELNVLKSWLS